jgi:hypothetical protein
MEKTHTLQDFRDNPSQLWTDWAAKEFDAQQQELWEKAFYEAWPKHWSDKSFLRKENEELLQKQQHMTPLSSNDPKLAEEIAKAMNNGPLPDQEKIDFIKFSVLPTLERQGIGFCLRAPANPILAKDITDRMQASPAGEETQSKYSTQDMKDFAQTRQELSGIRATGTQDHMRKYNTDSLKATGLKESPQPSLRQHFGFGIALDALIIHGKKIARSGWNGKNMFVYYVPPNSYPSVTNVAKSEFGEFTQYSDYMAIKNVDGTVSPWTPSVRDCLAKDWYIVE